MTTPKTVRLLRPKIPSALPPAHVGPPPPYQDARRTAVMLLYCWASFTRRSPASAVHLAQTARCAWWSLPVLAVLLLTGCPNPDPTEPELIDPGDIDLGAVTITSQPQSFTVPHRVGGNFTITSADNSSLFVEVPEFSNPDFSDRTITATVIDAIAGLPLGVALGAGFRLEPSGAQFLRPLALTFVLSEPPQGKVFGFQITDGSLFLIPVYPVSSVEFVTGINHFSDVGVFTTDGQTFSKLQSPVTADEYEHNVAAAFNGGDDLAAADAELGQWNENLIIPGQENAAMLGEIRDALQDLLLYQQHLQLKGAASGAEGSVDAIALVQRGIDLAEQECRLNKDVCQRDNLKQGLGWIELKQALGAESSGAEQAEFCGGLLPNTIVDMLTSPGEAAAQRNLPLLEGERGTITVLQPINLLGEVITVFNNESLKLAYESSNPGVASVQALPANTEAKAEVTAAAFGTATITVSEPCEEVFREVEVIVDEINNYAGSGMFSLDFVTESSSESLNLTLAIEATLRVGPLPPNFRQLLSSSIMISSVSDVEICDAQGCQQSTTESSCSTQTDGMAACGSFRLQTETVSRNEATVVFPVQSHISPDIREVTLVLQAAVP